MKTWEKIVGIIAVLAILGVIIVVFSQSSLFTSGNPAAYAVMALVLLPVVILLGYGIWIKSMMQKRITEFAKFAQEYSLQHTFIPASLFTPHGKLNTITGKIRNQNIEISDVNIEVSGKDVVADGAIQGTASLILGILGSASPSANVLTEGDKKKTRVYVDGQEVRYKLGKAEKGPFLSIEKINKILISLRA